MLKGKITITRVDRDGDGSEGTVIQIRIQDDRSRKTFVEATMTPHDFAMAIAGLSYQPATFEVDSLDKVGMTKETMPLEFPIGDWLTPEAGAIAACPEGWEPKLYFNSQTSKFTRDGEQWARTVAERWVNARSSD